MSGDLPTGTLTLLFTDIEGSTAIWENDPIEMDPAFHQTIEWVQDLKAGLAGGDASPG